MPVYRNVSFPLTEEQLEGLLKRHDADGDGRLSRKELKVALKNLGVRFSGWRARKAFRHADANDDGYISEEEMKELVQYAMKKWGITIA